MVKTKKVIKLLKKIRDEIESLDTTGLTQHTRNGESTMQDRVWDLVDDEIKKLKKKKK